MHSTSAVYLTAAQVRILSHEEIRRSLSSVQVSLPISHVEPVILVDSGSTANIRVR